MSKKERKSAWNFAFALIKFDNLEPSRDMVEMSKKEIEGKMTLAQIYEELKLKYGVKSNI